MDESDITVRKYFQPWPFSMSGSEGRLGEVINTNPTAEVDI